MVRPLSAGVIAAVVCCAHATSAHAQAFVGGSIRGVVTDREFGTPLAGVTVSVQGLRARAVTDDQGAFTLPGLAGGRYTLIFSREGYAREVRANVGVRDGELTDADAALAGEFEDMEDFVVQDLSIGMNESDSKGLFNPLDFVPIEYMPPIDFQLRLTSPQLLDTIGVEMITKSGASDAAAVLLLVPGATLENGKYAVIRGLPDRYVSTLLDGVRLPVADPNKRAVKLDQFPAAVIESIQVSKNFTPDQQGEASGGAVNIVLKDIPEESFLQVKAQVGGNSQVKDGKFLTYPGGRMDFWGGNDTLKTQPEIAGQSWPNNPTGTEYGSAPSIYKWSVAGGLVGDLDEGVRLGATANFFYDADASGYTNGRLDSLQQPGPGQPLVPEQFGVGDDFKTQLYNVAQGTQSIQWGGMAAVGLETDEHKIGAKVLYTLLSESQAVRLIDTRGKAYFFPGYDPNDLEGIGHDQPLAAPYNRLETLDYTQLSTSTLILNGSHELGFLGDPTGGAPGTFAFRAPVVDWRFAMSKATEDQPDQTQFAAYWIPDFQIFPGFVLPQQWIAYPPAQNAFVGWVQHINYTNEETSIQGALNLKLPFMQWNDREGYVKGGVFVDSVSRTYRQDTFSNGGDPNTSFSSSFDEPWSAVFPSQDHPINQSQTDISYDGSQGVLAFYGMVDMPVSETLNLIGGVRLESTTMSTKVLPDANALWIDVVTQTLVNFDGPNEWDADISENRLLPMVGFNWSIQEDLILRGAFAQTIARPNFFEIVPVLQYQFIGGPIFIGNPDLGFSSLNNYDLRLDWLPYKDWLISGSAFYKQITDPIQYVQRFTEGFSYTSPLNFPSATLFGVELESRITLAPLLGEEWEGLALGGNFTWMTSEVTLSAADRQAFTTYGIAASTQPMTATPEFLLNLNATYEFKPLGTQIGLFYNFKGDSLVSAASPNVAFLAPAVYQKGYGTLNFVASQQIVEGLRIAVQVKNITNPIIETEYRTPDGFTGLNSRYTAGINFSVGLSYQANF
jgi:outer membrane receptor protein involved in Fe transport